MIAPTATMIENGWPALLVVLVGLLVLDVYRGFR
jgi:hypothetical protein